MTERAILFRAILTGLMAVIAQIAAHDRPRAPFLIRVSNHLNRTIQRFEALVHRWRNNSLPKPGKPRPGRPQHPRATPRLPSGRAWLLRHVDHHNARASASQLQHFLASPDCAALLAQVPRAARLLRPLVKSLGLSMPGDPPPPPPKPAKPAKPVQPRALPWLRPQHIIAPAPAKPRTAYPPEFSKAR